MKRALLALALVACSKTSSPPPPPAASKAPVATQKAPATMPKVPDGPAVIPLAERGPSIYDLPIQDLTDADGRSIHLDVSRGHVTIVSMFYASCTVVCPLIIAELKQTLEELPPAVRADARVLLVSFDPARDTPQQLKQLVTERKLDAHWTLARPAEADARALAAVLHVQYRKLDDGQFAHNVSMTVLDRDGRPVARADQLGQRATLVRAVIAESAVPSS
ncbi:MAG TPA: SCO family protein [Kofleriaceae bacterium]|nr:SCO family protein [Kofleriaceae bacterium]